jgi:polyisoprenoid-binding protein YceI
MRGITKEVELSLVKSKPVEDPWGNQRVGLALSGVIDRNDFKISYNQKLKSGDFMIGNQVALEIQLEGILAK